MRKVMKALSWVIFLAFIGLSSFANWMHGTTPHAQFMLAVMPVGFAASVFILEGMISAGKAGKLSFVGIGFVALCAGAASYIGLYGMALDNGIGTIQAALMPLAFDGVVAVASMGIRAFSLSHVPAKPRTASRPKRDAVTTDVPAATSDVPATEAPKTADVPPDDRVAKALAMLSEGRDKKDVAETVGVSVRTLNRWIAAAQ